MAMTEDATEIVPKFDDRHQLAALLTAAGLRERTPAEVAAVCKCRW